MELIKKFRVVNRDIPDSFDEFFHTETTISKKVKLPFSESMFRVTMFNGTRVRLINEKTDQIIEGILS